MGLCLLHLHLSEDILVLVDQGPHLPQIEDASRGVRLHTVVHRQGATSPLLYLHLHEHILVLATRTPSNSRWKMPPKTSAFTQSLFSQNL